MRPVMHFQYKLLHCVVSMSISSALSQKCTAYLKARATNKSGTKVEGYNESLGAVPPVRSGAKPLKADDTLLIRP